MTATRKERNPDLQNFLKLFPDFLHQPIIAAGNNLVDIQLDLGQYPVIVYSDRPAEQITDEKVSQEHLTAALEVLGPFNPKERAGLPSTLHRISAIRSQENKIIGLTCRYGRATANSIDLIKQVIDADVKRRRQSILILGKPGRGKTSKLRGIANHLAAGGNERVIVIDGSGEIGGHGDVAHPSIGLARRMLVPPDKSQADIMLQALENHTPSVIVVDEISTEKEAEAARTIAERGVILIATAHGDELSNITKNPPLMNIVGGIETVTIGDAEARKRVKDMDKFQKSVSERKEDPTFGICIELISFTEALVHKDVGASVDNILNKRRPSTFKINLPGTIIDAAAA